MHYPFTRGIPGAGGAFPHPYGVRPGYEESAPHFCQTRGTTVQGNGIAIVMGRPQSAVEVHPPSANSVNMAGFTVEYYPPRPDAG